MSFVRNNGYDWYNTNIEGTTLHFNTAGAKVVDGKIYFNYAIFYKIKPTSACGPLGVTTPREYEAFTSNIDPINNFVIIEKMDGYAGSQHICTEYSQELKEHYFKEGSVFALWLKHWKSLQGRKPTTDSSSTSSRTGSGIETLLK